MMRQTAPWMMLVVGVLLGTMAHAQPAYVGQDGCKSCHKDEHADWSKSKHASAIDLLKPGKSSAAKQKAGLDPDKDYSADEKCLRCHVTGYRAAGGFESASATPALAGVGCESCHGPGSQYREIHKEKKLNFTKAEVMAVGQLYASQDPGVCKSCHGHKDNPFVPKLDAKYSDDVDALMKKNRRAFHDFYPLDGKH